MSTFQEMKKAQVMVPPRPKMRSHHERYNPVIMQSFYGILYRFDQNNKWENVEKDYIKINFLDFELSEHPYRLEAISGNEKILDFLITSSTKASAKGTFVRWGHDAIVHGVRFSKPDIAEEFCDQLCALSAELNTKLQENAHKSGVDLGSRKTSTGSVDSNTIMTSSHSKASTMVIEILLSNSELRQMSVEKETQVSGVLDKICKDEELDHTFYTIHYMNPTNSPVPLDCKVANLDSCQLRLVDKRDLQKSASLDMRKVHPEGRRFTPTFDRPIREDEKASYSGGEKDFVLEASDPLVKAFLEIANIHQYELRKPRVHSIVEGFIAERGGLRYLQQLQGSKLSRQVLDEIGEISQKVLSLAESPTKSDHQYVRVSSVRETSSILEEHYDLRRAHSLGNMLPSRKMDKKDRPPSKKKRQAPLPPGQTTATVRPSSLTLHSSKDIVADVEKVDRAEPPRVKRRAPLPPGAVGGQPKGVSLSLRANSNSNSNVPSIESSPRMTLRDRSSSLKSGEASRQESGNSSASPDEQGPILKSPPTFSAPPPPDESPPNEVYSPVGSFSAVTPSPTKEFKFMGELAKKLEARRSIIVHSDDDDGMEHQLTPKKGYGAKGNATASENHVSSPTDYTKLESGEATPVKDIKNSQSKTMNGDNSEGINVEELAIAVDVEESQMSSNVITNTFNEKDGKRKLEERTSENIKRRISPEMNAGYTVQLLENQMKTIHHSISSLQDIKDEKQRELLLKPLLLQETILQKMIDQERKNILDSHEIETGNQVRKVSLELSVVTESRAENTAGLRTEYDTESTDEKAVDDARSETLYCKETGEKPDIELTEKDTLVEDIDYDKEKAVKMSDKEEQSLIRGLDVEQRKCEEAQLRTDKEIQRKKDVERQMEIDDEKIKFEEEKRYVENEKQNKADLERNKLEKERCKLDSEILEVQVLGKNDFLTQRQREEKQLIFDKEEKIGAEQREKEEEKEKVRQQELEYRKIEEEKKKAELEKQEIELARKQREEERSRLEKELLKLKAEEQLRKEKEAKKKLEELQEIERLRKELEIQKKIENERLERERKEIEDLKRQLKEQRELQEEEAREKQLMEEKKLKEEAELQVKTHDKEQQHRELLDVAEKINLEDENMLSKSNNSESILNEDLSKPNEMTTEYVSQISNETVDIQTESSQAVDAGHDGKHAEMAHQSSVLLPEMKSAPGSTAGTKFDSHQSVPIRRPSSNLVSSAKRTADGETSKKFAPGLFAKIQQMANARSSAINVTDKKPENIEKEQKEKNLNDVRKKVGDSTLYPSKGQASSINTDTKVQHAVKPNQQAAVFAPEEIYPSGTFSPTISEVENSSPIVHQQKERKVKNASLSGTEATLLDKNQNCRVMKDVNNIDKLNGSVAESKSPRVQDTEVAMSNPVHGNLPNAFKPNLFLPISSVIKELNEKKGVNVNKHEKDLNEFPKVQEKETTLDQISTVDISNESEGNSQSLITNQNDLTTSAVTVGNDKKVHENRTGKETDRTVGAASDVDMFRSKGAYLPAFKSLSSFSSNGQKRAAANAAQPDDIELDLQGNLGNYRPKCISPDDLRSSLVLEKGKNAEENPNTASSAAILRNTLGKKVPPKVLPKTLPKTLPKPGSKVKGTLENPTHRETVKNHIDTNSKLKPEAKEKKRDHINLAAMQHRSLEISSGAISSNIMNKTILHDDRRGHSSIQSGERGRKLPNRPNMDVKTGQTVESEPVQAPSLLRRLSQNSLFVNSTSPNVSPGYSVGLEAEPGKTEITALGKILSSDKAYNEACEPTGRAGDGAPIRVGDYASVIDANETVERDTIPVKKVGGLNIGFGRDKPKVYST